MTCPCIPADTAGGTFAADFEAEFGVAPGAYAAEGYDAMTIFLEGLKDGNSDRADMLEFVNNYDEDGITKHIKFDENGDVEVENVAIWTYVIQGGELVKGEEIPKA